MTVDKKRAREIRRLIAGDSTEAKMFRLVVEDGWDLVRSQNTPSRPPRWYRAAHNYCLHSGQTAAAEKLWKAGVLSPTGVTAEAALVYLAEAPPPEGVGDGLFVLACTYQHVFSDTRYVQPRAAQTGLPSRVTTQVTCYGPGPVHLVPTSRLRATVRWLVRTNAGSDRIRRLFGDLPKWDPAARKPAHPVATLHVHRDQNANQTAVALGYGVVPGWRPDGPVEREPRVPGVYYPAAQADAEWGTWTTFNQMAALG